MGTPAIVSKLLKTGVIKITSLQTHPRELPEEVFIRLLHSGLLQSRGYDNEFVNSYNIELESFNLWLKNQGLDSLIKQNITITKQSEYTPILGWSMSRYNLFLWCKRKYYYTYYANYDELSDKINHLKSLTSIPLIIGITIHEIIETILKRLLQSQSSIQIEALLNYVREVVQRKYVSQTFIEVYYHKVKTVDLEELIQKSSLSLNNFLQSDRFSWITTIAIPYRNQWIIEPDKLGNIWIDGIKAYFKVDFLTPLDDKLFIMDWKTGKQKDEKYRKQLIGYAIWASSQFNKPVENIIPIIAYCSPSYEEVNISVAEQERYEFVCQLKNETEAMYAFCQDIERNIPKGRDVFLQTEDKEHCEYCNFQELCSDS